MKSIHTRAHDLIAEVTPSFLLLLPDLPCDYTSGQKIEELSLSHRSLLLARFALLRRSFFRWSRINYSIAVQRVRTAFSCWVFQSCKPRLPFETSLKIRDILQPSCRSGLLTSATALIFFCKSGVRSTGSNWIQGIVLFVKRCIVQHICERMLGWHDLLSTRRLTIHWRVVASQLALVRTLHRWRRRQKLTRHFRGWRESCDQECKIRHHRCYYDAFSHICSMRRCLALWCLYTRRVSLAKTSIANAAIAIVVRRAFFAWQEWSRVATFVNGRFRRNFATLTRKVFDRLRLMRSSAVYFKFLIERMRASVPSTYKNRSFSSAFASFFPNSASTHHTCKKRQIYFILQCISSFFRIWKAFQKWASILKENQLRTSQQVTA
jgi:hypothetical protein